MQNTEPFHYAVCHRENGKTARVLSTAADHYTQ